MVSRINVVPEDIIGKFVVGYPTTIMLFNRRRASTEECFYIILNRNLTLILSHLFHLACYESRELRIVFTVASETPKWARSGDAVN